MRSSSSPPMFADNVLICIQIKEGVEVNGEVEVCSRELVEARQNASV